MKKILTAVLSFAVSASFCTADADSLKEYEILLTDLRNRNLYGYKGHLDPVTLTGGRIVPGVQGALEFTGDPFDVAILGEGFFGVRLTDGTTAYTRNGDFSVNGKGNLATADGFRLSDTIPIPPGCEKISVGADGTVRAVTVRTENGNAEALGRLKLYRLDATLITGERGAIVLTDEAAPSAVETGAGGNARMLNRMLEQSSVDVLPTLRRLNDLLNLMTDTEMPGKETKRNLLEAATTGYSGRDIDEKLNAILPFLDPSTGTDRIEANELPAME